MPNCVYGVRATAWCVCLVLLVVYNRLTTQCHACGLQYNSLPLWGLEILFQVAVSRADKTSMTTWQQEAWSVTNKEGMKWFERFEIKYMHGVDSYMTIVWRTNSFLTIIMKDQVNSDISRTRAAMSRSAGSVNNRMSVDQKMSTVQARYHSVVTGVHAEKNDSAAVVKAGVEYWSVYITFSWTPRKHKDTDCFVTVWPLCFQAASHMHFKSNTLANIM